MTNVEDNAQLASVEARLKGLEALQTQLNDRLDGLEKIQAVLITMYAEMFAGIEALASVVTNDDEETAQKLNERRNEVIKALHGVLGQNMNMDDMDDETRASMEHFVRGTNSSTS